MNSKNTRRLRIIVSGNVQRVGFRHVASIVAVKNNLTGFACYTNLDVIIEAEGPIQNLESFLNWAQSGPEGCYIENFEYYEIPPVKSTIFEIVPGITIDAEDKQLAM